MVFSNTPAARNVRVQSRQPVIRSSGGKCFISGHEEIATISGSVTFTATKYEINPGLPLYTWLKTQAIGWEKYKFRKLQYVYVPAEAVTTTAGSIYLCADYDPTDAAPSSLAGLSTYETQCNSRVYESTSLNVSSQRMFDGIQAKKIRCGPVGGDLQLYDGGSVSVGTISCANTDAIGQLWVYYEIELISRQTEPTAFIPHNLYVANVDSNQAFTSTVTAPTNFDEVMSEGFAVTNTSGVYSLPCGAFEIYGEITVADSSAEELTSNVECWINGAVTVPFQGSNMKFTVPTLGRVENSFQFFYASAVPFTFQLSTTLTGAAGTLEVLADRSRLFIKAV
jgi:hypothetical protein